MYYLHLSGCVQNFKKVTEFEDVIYNLNKGYGKIECQISLEIQIIHSILPRKFWSSCRLTNWTSLCRSRKNDIKDFCMKTWLQTTAVCNTKNICKNLKCTNFSYFYFKQLDECLSEMSYFYEILEWFHSMDQSINKIIWLQNQ